MPCSDFLHKLILASIKSSSNFLFGLDLNIRKINLGSYCAIIHFKIIKDLINPKRLDLRNECQGPNFPIKIIN